MSAQNVASPIGPLDALSDALEIPDSAYDAASSRYRDLSEWLQDASRSSSAQFHPIVSPQGSFRLGTPTRPWKRDSYDLDLTCVLRHGIDQKGWTQERVKALVGADLEAYRRERGIQEPLEEKHRCWRLNYRDNLTFHMDAVPAIPQADPVRTRLQELMITSGSPEPLAHHVSRLAVAITDDRHPQYRRASSDWLKSNPEGYARWFEARMRQAEAYLHGKARRERVESVDELPVYLWKTPLQRSIQILKRHRDVMFEHSPDVKPVSIIITTLAARAYAGEPDLQAALGSILTKMEEYVGSTPPRVPNPVNPEEDFADRWGTKEGRRLDLERHFRLWLQQARIDFDLFVTATSVEAMADQAKEKFGTQVEQRSLASIVGPLASGNSVGAVHQIRRQDAPKPWRR